MKLISLHIKITLILLIVAFLAQSISKVFIVANYYSNRKVYVAKCINKATPMMHCNGKCQLKKQLKQEENKDNQNAEHKNEVKTNLLFFAFHKSAIIPLQNIHKRKFPSVQNTLTQDISADFFHPPSVVSVLHC